jgi:hypothetical protein
LAEQFAELQHRLKIQAKEHELILNQLQEARDELQDIIINSKCLLPFYEGHILLGHF